MSDLNKIMSLTVNNLAKEQHEALKKHVIKILQDVINDISHERYDKNSIPTEYCQSVEELGDGNDFIDFGYNCDYPLDICQVIRKLKNLKNVAKGE